MQNQRGKRYRYIYTYTRAAMEMEYGHLRTIEKFFLSYGGGAIIIYTCFFLCAQLLVGGSPFRILSPYTLCGKFSFTKKIRYTINIFERL